ncbi:MAG TPA: cytochrome c [Acidobacteriaceae bacterium]|nr:cytochrome c [Acidobacteriaceae bacterium]
MRKTRRQVLASGIERAVRVTAIILSTGAMLVLAGCRQDMQDEPKFFPQRGTTFYPDGRSVRPQVANTVARNQGNEDSYFYTGLINGKEGDGLPIDLTPDTMARGQERFNVYCTPCHSRVGNGDGMIVQRGYRPAGDFHTDRLRSAPLGHFFAVMTNGYGAMPDYAAQITPQDRWAIAAYIRALQLSQNAKQSDVPAGAHVEDLHQIANDQGMPPGFADPWGLPSTAVYGTPNGQDNGIPGQGTTTAPAGSQTHGNSTAAQPSTTRNSSGPPLAKPDAQAPGRLAGPQH